MHTFFPFCKLKPPAGSSVNLGNHWTSFVPFSNVVRRTRSLFTITHLFNWSVVLAGVTIVMVKHNDRKATCGGKGLFGEKEKN